MTELSRPIELTVEYERAVHDYATVACRLIDRYPAASQPPFSSRELIGNLWDEDVNLSPVAQENLIVTAGLPMDRDIADEWDFATPRVAYIVDCNDSRRKEGEYFLRQGLLVMRTKKWGQLAADEGPVEITVRTLSLDEVRLFTGNLARAKPIQRWPKSGWLRTILDHFSGT